MVQKLVNMYKTSRANHCAIHIFYGFQGHQTQGLP